MFDVTIIGGGPSGLMAAIAAAEQGANTLLIDKGDKLGRKLAISGGGRCNVTNRLPTDEVIRHIPGNGRFLYSAFSTFDNYDIIDYFEGLGVALKEEDHGRMFPVSNKASDVVDALLQQLARLGVTIRKNCRVEAIDYGEQIHQIILENRDKIATKTVIIAAGGKAVPHTGSTGDAYPWAKKAGHTITSLYPTEVPITSNETFIQDKVLQGTALRDVALSVYHKDGKKVITHRMDMLFTHFGISGPAVLRCSQFIVKLLMTGEQDVKVSIDLLPDIKTNSLLQQLQKAIQGHPKKSFKNVIKGYAPERVLDFLLTQQQIDPALNCANLSKDKLETFTNSLKQFTFYVHGSLPLKKAFVTGGGVSIKEIVPSTLQSKLMHGLYFCGEVLDIHGYTGGYNITSALVTGRVAGMHAAWESFSQ
ncbi:BaiN/RdsA family NAD(P)/FAD-dependent oxidoreductase [Gracilibacillus alcaliphilus]|uniref:NAD(P)/FAD-dependent oxidoreductase n=1 Tax=Gracilibacillus alcaliphilus TaxID=1401441 RepID=UPI00195CA64A|nr:NAD(P)/FAD-dependent oxidoreductase [Gracilibacillus alcaliphilus]MBM7679482.1 putative Rossmann fold flavoprotein [Gracilibacillus alcaliphilus]